MTNRNSQNEDGDHHVPLNPNGAPQIPAEHLKKVALIYLPHSTPEQVQQPSGGTDGHRELAELLRNWGWPDSLIKIIKDHLGGSGPYASGRPGFEQILDLIERGEVGIVLIPDVCHLTRDPLNAERLLMKCIRARTLIEINGRVIDPATEALPQLFALRIQGLLAWRENQTRAQMLRTATEAKVRHGFAVTRPPVGYVAAGRGRWVKDPDIKVREAVQRIFDLYLKLRSTRRVETYCHQRHLRFPERVHWEVRWKPVTARGVHRLLTNPAYAGDYVYQRYRRLPPDETQTRRRLILRPSAEWFIYRDHHEAYLSREGWEAIQAMLAACRLLRHQRVDPAHPRVPLAAGLPPRLPAADPARSDRDHC